MQKYSWIIHLRSYHQFRSDRTHLPLFNSTPTLFFHIANSTSSYLTPGASFGGRAGHMSSLWSHQCNHSVLGHSRAVRETSQLSLMPSLLISHSQHYAFHAVQESIVFPSKPNEFSYGCSHHHSVPTPRLISPERKQDLLSVKVITESRIFWVVGRPPTRIIRSNSQMNGPYGFRALNLGFISTIL